MSTIADLPASAVRDYRLPTEVNVVGLYTLAQKATAAESWLCPMVDRTAFLTAVVGLPVVVGGPAGNMTRTVSLQHPEYPGLYAVGARSKGLGFDARSAAVLPAGTPGPYWAWCKITVEFDSWPWQASGSDAFLSIAGQPATRPLPGPAVAFRIGGIPPVYDPGDDVDGEDQTITIHQLSTLPLSTYDGLRNCVNLAAFRGRPAGTVLFRGASYTTTSNFQGTQYDAALQFSYSTVPWNYGYNPDGTLSPITRADGSLRWKTADFSALFQ